MKPEIKKLLKVLDYWFVPSSWIRDVHKRDKNIKYSLETKIAEYVSATAFELLRLGIYYGLATHNLEKYL
jgi:hypothetical protein